MTKQPPSDNSVKREPAPPPAPPGAVLRLFENPPPGLWARAIAEREREETEAYRRLKGQPPSPPQQTDPPQEG